MAWNGPGRAPAAPVPPRPLPAAERAPHPRPARHGRGRRLAAATRGRGISTWETLGAKLLAKDTKF